MASSRAKSDSVRMSKVDLRKPSCYKQRAQGGETKTAVGYVPRHNTDRAVNIPRNAARSVIAAVVVCATCVSVARPACKLHFPTVLAFCQGPEEPPRHTEPQPRGRPRRFSESANLCGLSKTYMLKLSAYLTRNIINLPNANSLLGLFITPSRHHADRRFIEY
jgi:hypothetical protein